MLLLSPLLPLLLLLSVAAEPVENLSTEAELDKLIAAAQARKAALRSQPDVEPATNVEGARGSVDATLARAARHSPDKKTVALCFGTFDFIELLLNWACHVSQLGVRWFVIVAMDAKVYAALQSVPKVRAHTLLLPRSKEHNITKLTVIGERQRFGLHVLERGFSIVHSDADAYWIRDPWPLISAGDDVVAERIWGKPPSVVKAWGAAICTGWYYMRSSPATIALARKTRDEIEKKRARQSSWQASDQYCINIALQRDYALKWDSDRKMDPISSMSTRFTDMSTFRGTANTPDGRLRVALLAHGVIPRACPVLSPTELAKLDAARSAGVKVHGKAHLWQSLLASASVIHCFPPGGDPTPGEKRFIFMGHPKHTNAEVNFARQQRLWRLQDDWNTGDNVCAAPSSA